MSAYIVITIFSRVSTDMKKRWLLAHLNFKDFFPLEMLYDADWHSPLYTWERIFAFSKIYFFDPFPVINLSDCSIIWCTFSELDGIIANESIVSGDQCALLFFFPISLAILFGFFNISSNYGKESWLLISNKD